MSLRADLRIHLGSLDLEVNLQAGEEEVVAILGPNGAGKTTLLRALAGLQPIDTGTVVLDGIVLDDAGKAVHVPTEKRPIGVVFQDYLLFPHLSVLDNVAFGLRCGGRRRREADSVARTWLARVGLEQSAGVLPAQLSGGQRQRVALVRALATGPRLLLLDEPLAALDVATRAEVRRDIRTHLSSFRGIRLLVTHDPLEAVALADRLIVIEHGRVIQSGSPAAVTERPRSDYVAELVGVNLYRGQAGGGTVRLPSGQVLATTSRAEGDVFAVIHPRAIVVHRARPEGSSQNVWPGEALGIEPNGDTARLRVAGPLTAVAEITPRAVAELRLSEGGEVWISVKATEVSVYPA